LAGVAGAPVATSNNCVRQNPGTATRRSSGEKAADRGEPFWVGHTATCEPSLTRHSDSVRSFDPLARIAPSRLKSTP
jgi:hypothetical protein